MLDGLRARYDSEAGATAYATKYERGLLRRLSGRRELRLVRWALGTAGARGSTALDVPCGAGRLVPVLLERFDRVTGLDRSPTMVAQAMDRLATDTKGGRVVLGEGDAASLPFAEGAFHLVVCWRLLHHLTARADRVAILRELARVSRAGVVISFADAGTWKARFQRWRRRNRRCAKVSREDLAGEATDAGLALVATRRLSSLFSLQAAAVLAPKQAAGAGGTTFKHSLQTDV